MLIPDLERLIALATLAAKTQHYNCCPSHVDFKDCPHPDCVFVRFAADRGRASGWQPISEAPKDGTSVLLSDGKQVTYGGWISAADQGAEPGEEHLIAAGWWSVDLSDNNPTHFLPLPSPPGSASLPLRGKE